MTEQQAIERISNALALFDEEHRPQALWLNGAATDALAATAWQEMKAIALDKPMGSNTGKGRVTA